MARPIDAADTVPIRNRVLRPGRPRSECVYAEDGAPGSFHLGAFAAGDLVGIASFYAEPPPWEPSGTALRLRGMATLPEVRGAGLGRLLLTAGHAEGRARGALSIWCNARTPAVGFYRHLGYATHGEEFELAGIGPHFRMWRPLGKLSKR